MHRFGLFAFVVLLSLVRLSAQTSTDLSVAWIYQGGPAQFSAAPTAKWLQDNTLFVKDGDRWDIFNPTSGDRHPALDASAALKSLAASLGRSPQSLPAPQGLDAAMKRGLYAIEGDLFVLEFATATFRRLTATPGEEKSARLSPDGEHVAFIRGNDLWVTQLATGTERRLTHDGAELIKNGTLSWVYWEEIFGRQDTAYWWSPDSKSLAFLRTDESMVSEVVHLDFQPAVAKVIKQRYPKAGQTNPSVRLGLIDLSVESPKPTWVTLDKNGYEYLVRVKWFPDSKRVAVQTLDRAHQNLDLWWVDAKTGVGTTVLRETDPGWVNVHDDLYFLADSQHFLWVSERDGWSHLYRYTLEGKLVNQVTKGPWALHASSPVFWLRQAVQAIDETNGWVYFGSLHPDPVQTHTWRVKLDGTGLEQITKERGVHSVSMSPDGRYLLDDYSNLATPPSLRVLKNEGAPMHEFAAPKTPLVEVMQLCVPELIQVPARDGFKMPGYIVKPKDFDPTKKYPLIFYTYGGPSSRNVVDSWNRDIYWNTLLARAGFLVTCVDNRSATGQSKTLENTIAGKMTSDGELNDVVDAVTWLKSQSFVDPARVGIWGWSNGGMMTLLCMTRSDLFKAGVSVAPVTDWTYYDSIWCETVNRTPAMNPEGYEHTNLCKRAKDLQGHLLLVHGTYDDNVHIQNTWNFVDELVKAGKLFELMVYPMRMHGISDAPARIHLYTTMLSFWKRNL